METLLVSTLAVAVAEMGDRTQLLALVLVARYRRSLPVILGIVVATLANHAAAAWFGRLAAGWLSSSGWNEALSWVLGLGFLIMGLWLLRPDSLEEEASPATRARGAFLATIVLFFVVEMGDKTQVATVMLGAHYDGLAAVVAGTTLGMLLANVPVILGGVLILRRLPLTVIRYAAAGVFVALGVLIVWWA